MNTNNDINVMANAYAFAESISLSKNYIFNYFLTDDEYLGKWQSIQRRIFNLKSKFPDLVFHENFTLLPLKGGVLFSEQDFDMLKECMQATKDEYFTIIEDFDELNPPHDSGPRLKFTYPSTIQWKEICINDGVSYEMFQRPNRNFYVFGDKGFWGRYVASDYVHPVDIYGIHPSFFELFEKKFQIHVKDKHEVLDWLPPIYKDRISLSS